MAYDKTVTIDGVDVTNYIVNFSVVDTIEDLTSANLALQRSVLSVLDLYKEQELVITEGTTTAADYTIFRGYVSEVFKTEGMYIKIDALDKLWTLSRVTLSKTFDINIDDEAGVISAIAETLITEYGGLTASVQDSGTTFTLDQYIMRSKSLLDALNELAGLIDYQVYYDADDDIVYFVPRGFTSFSTPLVVGTNVSEAPNWKIDKTAIINNIEIVGNEVLFETQENSVGTASQTSIGLSFSPEIVLLTIDGVEQVGGIIGQSSPFNYSIDKVNKQLLLQSALSGGEVIVADYSYRQRIRVTQKNPTSIATYGQYSARKTIDTVQTVDDAVLKAQEVIDKFAEPTIQARSVKVYNVYGIKAGDEIEIDDPIGNETLSVKVRRIRHNFPVIIKELDIDDFPMFEEYVRDTMIRQRIEELERKNENDTDLVITRISYDKTVQSERRYCAATISSVAGTALIWGHPTFGIWGTYRWSAGSASTFILGSGSFGILGTGVLGSALTSPITYALVQGNMTYQEYCYDEDFHDSTTSTATFDTSNERIDFTAGQVWQSLPFDVGSSISQVQVDLGTTTGSFTIEVSADNGTTYQTITPGVAQTLTSSDATAVLMRITEADGSTGRIEPTTDTYGQRTFPAIKCRMIQ